MLDFFLPYLPLLGLLIFGNIENLVLASQGVVAGANSLRLAILSICCVIFWLFLGTVGTQVAIQYSDVIEFIGGFAIFALGIQAMLEARKMTNETEEIIDEYNEENGVWVVIWLMSLRSLVLYYCLVT